MVVRPSYPHNGNQCTAKMISNRIEMIPHVALQPWSKQRLWEAERWVTRRCLGLRRVHPITSMKFNFKLTPLSTPLWQHSINIWLLCNAYDDKGVNSCSKMLMALFSDLQYFYQIYLLDTDECLLSSSGCIFGNILYDERKYNALCE